MYAHSTVIQANKGKTERLWGKCRCYINILSKYFLILTLYFNTWNSIKPLIIISQRILLKRGKPKLKENMRCIRLFTGNIFFRSKLHYKNRLCFVTQCSQLIQNLLYNSDSFSKFVCVSADQILRCLSL
jgi:hypothetical protein